MSLVGWRPLGSAPPSPPDGGGGLHHSRRSLKPLPPPSKRGGLRGESPPLFISAMMTEQANLVQIFELARKQSTDVGSRD